MRSPNAETATSMTTISYRLGAKTTVFEGCGLHVPTQSPFMLPIAAVAGAAPCGANVGANVALAATSQAQATCALDGTTQFPLVLTDCATATGCCQKSSSIGRAVLVKSEGITTT